MKFEIILKFQLNATLIATIHRQKVTVKCYIW